MDRKKAESLINPHQVYCEFTIPICECGGNEFIFTRNGFGRPDMQECLMCRRVKESSFKIPESPGEYATMIFVE